MSLVNIACNTFSLSIKGSAGKDTHGLATVGFHVLNGACGNGKLVIAHASLHASNGILT